MDFLDHSNFELISLVLPERRQEQAIQAAREAGAVNIMHKVARGSILSEKQNIFSRMFPPPSPKQGIYQMLVPAAESSHFMQQVIKAGHLNVSGAGAVFSAPTSFVSASENYNLWEGKASDEHDVLEKESKFAIICIVERGYADPIAHAAINAGTPGPTVFFAEGYGLRDKNFLLRVTKTVEKEMVIVVVDEVDLQMVFNEMSAAGDITEPGRGFIYAIPLTHSLINIPSMEGSQKFSASMQEIIKAIDEIKGSKAWRGFHPLENALKQQQSDAHMLKNLTNMTCVVERSCADKLKDVILAGGAPAVSVSHGRLWGRSFKDVEHVENLSTREWSELQSIVPASKMGALKETITQEMGASAISALCLYALPVPQASTYLGNA